jgi:hypothetical protein
MSSSPPFAAAYLPRVSTPKEERSQWKTKKKKKEKEKIGVLGGVDEAREVGQEASLSFGDGSAVWVLGHQAKLLCSLAHAVDTILEPTPPVVRVVVGTQRSYWCRELLQCEQ